MTMRKLLLALFTTLSSLSCGRPPVLPTTQVDISLAEPRVRYKWSFDPAPHLGTPSSPSPIQSTVPRTRLLAVLGAWGVQRDDNAPSAPHVMKLERSDSHAARLLVERLGFTSVSARVKCRIDDMREDASCGVIFGARAEDDYFVARIDGHEIRLLHVVGAVETELGKSTALVDRASFHDVMVWTRGGDAFVSLDGALSFSAKMPDIGIARVGLWARGDASFDDLSAMQLDRPDS
jgi:hypothetical protein